MSEYWQKLLTTRSGGDVKKGINLITTWASTFGYNSEQDVNEVIIYKKKGGGFLKRPQRLDVLSVKNQNGGISVEVYNEEESESLYRRITGRRE